MCYPENLAVSVNAIGVALAQGRTAEELALISTVFMQLADTLATIAAARSICESAQEQTQTQAQEKPQQPTKPPN